MIANEDVVQQITGNFGRWQMRSIIFVFLCKIPATWFMACISYTAPLPKSNEYHCKSPPTIVNETQFSPHNHSWINVAKDFVPQHYHELPQDKCQIYRTVLAQSGNYTSPHSVTPIDEIITCKLFEHHARYASIVTQFDLVCSREVLVSVTQAFHAFGGLIGVLITLHLLKYLSPKKLLVFGMIGQIGFGNITGMVSTFVLHVYFRCLTAVFCAFMTTSGQIILADITAGKARTLVITLSEIFSSVGLIIMPGLAVFVDSWTSLYVVMSSSLLILLYPSKWLTDSPRWFLQHSNINRALQILLESAAFNNQEIPMDLEQRLLKIAKDLQKVRKPSCWCIWDGETPRHFIFLLHWCWSVSAVIYTIMILMIRFIGVDRMYVSTFTMGVAEILGILMGLSIIMYTRRRWLYAGNSMIAAGIATFFLWLIPTTLPHFRQNAYELFFWLILKCINSSSLVLLTICSGDFVPPEKRSVLMISTGSFSRFWLTVCPFALTLLKIHRFIPITIFATAVISSGFVMIYFNRHFRNVDQPKIQKTPTPNTYRKMLSSILSRHDESRYIDTSDESSCSDAAYDNEAVSISMEELCRSKERRTNNE